MPHGSGYALEALQMSNSVTSAEALQELADSGGSRSHTGRHGRTIYLPRGRTAEDLMNMAIPHGIVFASRFVPETNSVLFKKWADVRFLLQFVRLNHCTIRSCAHRQP